jgi:hypothetical protein
MKSKIIQIQEAIELYDRHFRGTGRTTKMLDEIYKAVTKDGRHCLVGCFSSDAAHNLAALIGDRLAADGYGYYQPAPNEFTIRSRQKAGFNTFVGGVCCKFVDYQMLIGRRSRADFLDHAVVDKMIDDAIQNADRQIVDLINRRGPGGQYWKDRTGLHGTKVTAGAAGMVEPPAGSE